MDNIEADEVARLMPWAGLIDRLEHVFMADVESPPRHHHTIHRADGEATMLLMPAWEKTGYLGVKWVNVYPQNAARGLPAIAGVYVLCDGNTGQPLACIEGSELTRRRTAAASALAARLLARADAETLLVIGTGQMAPMLIEAHASVRPIRRVRIWGRRFAKARALATQYAEHFDCAPVENLEKAVREADIVSCATLSTQPLVQGAWLSPGVHLDLVGAFRPDMRETDGPCLARAEVFVDTYGGAQNEAGDIHCAIEEGYFRFQDIRADMAELLHGHKPGRSDTTAITLFKSVGAALEDLAAAIEIYRRATCQRRPR